MQDLWNHLAAMRLRAEAEGPGSGASVSFWKILNEPASRLSTEFGLNWEAGPDVIERFRSACGAAYKNKRGWPQQRSRLDRIAIPHRYTRGGVTVPQVFSARARRFWLKQVDPWAYTGKSRRHTKARFTHGVFGLMKDQAIKFETVLHRGLPADARIKRVTWLGRSHPTRGWQWAIAITAEIPEQAMKRRTRRACAIDLCWLMMGEFLRVAVVYDDAGIGLEVRLPLDASTSDTRRRGLPSGYRDLLDYDSQMGRLLEDVKVRVRKTLPKRLPSEAQVIASTLTTARQGGLVRLLRALQVVDRAPDAQLILRRWLVENDRLRAIKQALSDRLVGRRRWLYQNLAAWLCRRYSVIAWKGNLNISRLLERPDQPPVLKLARRYHQWGAVGELRRFIELAAAKFGARLSPADQSNSIVRCAICGEDSIDDRSRLILSCRGGHRFDQDLNAARNLLFDEQAKDQSQPLRRHKVTKLDIPVNLRAMIVTVLPE